MTVDAFAFEPNWDERLLERLIWRTDVMMTASGLEQRVQLKSHPKIELEYSVLVEGREARLLNSILYRFQPLPMAVPFWHEGDALSSPLPAGSSAIPIDTTGRGYVAGSHAILWKSCREYEVVEVGGITSGQLTLAAPTAAQWNAGVMVCPAHMGMMQEVVRLDDVTADLRKARLLFELKPLAIGGRYASTPPPIRYFPGEPEGDDVVLDLWPDRAHDLSIEYQRIMDRIDLGFGVFEASDRTGFPVPIKRYNWVLGSRFEIAAFKSFLMTARGRLSPFWFIDDTFDLKVAAPIEAASDHIVVENAGFYEHVRHGTHRDAVCILLTEEAGGGMHFLRITEAWPVDAERETIYFASPVGFSAAADQVVLAAFMLFGRNNADKVEIYYDTPEAARASMTARGAADASALRVCALSGPA